VFTLVSGIEDKDMARGNKFGQMVVSMTVNGKIILLMVRVDLFMRMEIVMREIGRMTGHKG
jgi:hypothetical protein